MEPRGADRDPMAHAAGLSVTVVTRIDARTWSPDLVIPAHTYTDEPGSDR